MDPTLNQNVNQNVNQNMNQNQNKTLEQNVNQNMDQKLNQNLNQTLEQNLNQNHRITMTTRRTFHQSPPLFFWRPARSSVLTVRGERHRVLTRVC